MVPRTPIPREITAMAEHPDSLWQPYPEEVGRVRAGRPEGCWPTTPHRAHRAVGSAERAVVILEERYARGEIDRGELEERRAVLRGGIA